MNQQHIRLGVFAALGIGIIVGFSFFVNDQPFWYRACNAVDIAVDDATGLRRKSPVKTLGLDIGYIKAVTLDSSNVVVSVCITAPVQLRSDTKAYVRSIGFLGDRFLELKPVDVNSIGPTSPKMPSTPLDENEESNRTTPARNLSFLNQALEWLVPTAGAAEAEAASLISTAEAQGNPVVRQNTQLQAQREAELTDTMKKVSKLVDQFTLLLKDLRQATSQVEFKDLIVNLNQAASNMATLLEPKGAVTGNIKKSLESLRSSLDEFDKAVKKINRGEGTIGKLINDEKLYDEALAAVRGINTLIGKAGSLRVFVDLSADQVPAYDGAKARFFLMIEPNPTRYYLFGVSTDPRGVEERTTTQLVVNGVTTNKEEKIVSRERGLNITAAFGKYFGPLDLRVGLIENAAAIGVGYWLDEEHSYGIMTEVYKLSKRDPYRVRVVARSKIFSGLYVRGGVEDVKKVGNKLPYFFGAGLFFNDEDIKYLLAFR